MAGLNIGQFQFRRAIFEVRYPNAYRLWDRAGEIWNIARKRWGDIELREAGPGKTVFWLNEETELSALLERAAVIHHFPKKFEVFEDIAAAFFDLVQENLELYELDRIGLRLIYSKEFDSKQKASQAMLSTNLVLAPRDQQFNIVGELLLPEYAIRLENDKRGAIVRVKAEEERIEVTPPLQLRDEVKKVKSERHFVIFDVDYYTIGTTTVSQLRVKDWIEGAHQVIRRDSKTFLGG